VAASSWSKNFRWPTSLSCAVGPGPHWRGIHDEDGRLTVAIHFNMDLGDAWEHADNPGYPQPLTALAYRYAINYLVYSMSH